MPSESVAPNTESEPISPDPGSAHAASGGSASASFASRSNRLRVAQFCDNYGPGSNGLMVAVQQLEGALLDAGHEVIVVVPKAKGPNPHFGRAGRTEIRLPSMRVPRMPTRVATTHKFRSAIKELEELQPDLIHVHGLGPVGILGVWAARALGVPMVLTWHTDFEAYAKHYQPVLPPLIPVIKYFAMVTQGAVWTLGDLREAKEDQFVGKGWAVSQLLGVCRAMISNATVVTSPSRKTADRCRDIYPEAQPLVIANGVDPLPSGPPPLPHPDGPLVTYAGRIAPEKGIPLLVAGFEHALQYHPSAKLMVIGDWEPYPDIRELLEIGQENGYIILPGEQIREDLGAFYEMSDLFVFASQTDTQALVLHEAAAAGLPIVSVDRELDMVVKEGENGFFADPNPQSLGDTISYCLQRLEDPQWAASAKAKSRELSARYSIASQSQAYLDLYAQTVTNWTPPPDYKL